MPSPRPARTSSPSIPKAGPHLHRTVQRIKALGKKAGVSLNPATPAKALDYVLEEIDLVLVMSVNPGFGGQKFIASQLRKIEAIANRIAKEKLDVAGRGRRRHRRRKPRRRPSTAGANVLVAGTAAFRGGPSAYAANIEALRGDG